MIQFNHFNFNVLDLDRNLEFYDKALGLTPAREKNASDNYTATSLASQLK